ncbi:hypothetical protein MBLNU457_4282t1 [Dothideomycetes sp. NU457]
MYTPSPDPRDDYQEWKIAFQAVREASRRLQSILESDETPSSSPAVASVNTRPTEERPVMTSQPPLGLVVDGNVQDPTEGISEPVLLSPFRDQRQTKRKRRSRRQGMIFKDQVKANNTEDTTQSKKPPKEDKGPLKTKGKAEKKTTKAIQAVKAANDEKSKDGMASSCNHNISDNETGSIGKRKRTTSLGSDPVVTHRVLADSPALRNWQRTGDPMAETDLAVAILSGVKSHIGQCGAVEVGGPSESRQSKEKGRLAVVGGKDDLDVGTQRNGTTEESSKRGQLKRPDFDRVRRA